MASLLHRRRSTDVNQTLHDVWPSPALLYYIYTLEVLAPDGIFSAAKIHFASKSCILLYWQRYCTTLEQRPSAILCGVILGMELRNFRRGRHLYSAGRPSRWASAHFLVCIHSLNCCRFSGADFADAFRGAVRLRR